MQCPSLHRVYIPDNQDPDNGAQIEIQMDYETHKIPMVETLQMVCGFENAKLAGKCLARICDRHPSFLERLGDPVRLNRKGNKRFCADLSLACDILKLAPTKRVPLSHIELCIDALMQKSQSMQQDGPFQAIGANPEVCDY